MELRKTARKALKFGSLHLLFIAVCFIALVPIIYALAISFSGTTNLTGGIFAITDFTFDNYLHIFTELDFGTWLGNSLILSLSTVLVTVIPSAFAAYAFATMSFRGKRVLLFLLLILNAFPQVLTMTALFALLRNTHLLNTRIALILVYSGSNSIFAFFNLKGYFASIPSSISEAATIDGATRPEILFKVVLPLARPAIIVTSILVFINCWNEYLFASTFLTGKDLYTLASGLYALQSNNLARNWPQFAAASLFISLPVLIVFFLMQRYMVSGLTAGGVKE